MKDHYEFDSSGYDNRSRSGGGCLSIIIALAIFIGIFLGISRFYDTSPTDLLRYYAATFNLDEYLKMIPGLEDLLDSLNIPVEGDAKDSQSSSELENPEPHSDVSHESTADDNMAKHSPAISQDELQEHITAQIEGTGDITDESQAGYYCYNLLDDSEKTVYREILDALVHWKEREISTLDSDELNKIYNYVMSDHPEIFYTNGVHYTQKSINGMVTAILVKGQYTMSETEAAQYQAQLLPAIQSILSTVPGYADGTTTDDFTKIRYLYDYIVGNTDYVAGADENQNIISVLLNHRSVCNGYAKTLQYLSQLMGIPAILVGGTAEGGPHAWNVILMDGAWYQIDVTFGESNVSSQKTDVSFINYAYLGLTSDEMYVNHTVDNNIPVPDCTATQDNYFVYTGTYFTDADISSIGELARAAQTAGENLIQFRTADSSTMDAITDKLFTQHMIYNYLSNITSCTYVLNDAQNTLIILF